MNSLKLWLTLKMHGRAAYQSLIDDQMQLAGQLAAWVKSSEEFELAAPQVLPIVNFRLTRAGHGDELAKAHMDLVERVTRDGRRWVSETRVAGRSVIRVMIVSYLTGRPQLQDLQDALLQAVKKPLLRGAEVGSGERTMRD